MKVSILATTTIDGFIAKSCDHLADWSSKEDKQLFVSLTKEAGVMIMGSTTFDTIGRPLPERKTVVYTSNPQKYDGIDVLTTQDEPGVIINQLGSLGYSHVVICGGAHIYDLFMQSGLVTDLHITISPLAFGQGISLFKSSLNTELKLVSSEVLGEATIYNHYTVV